MLNLSIALTEEGDINEAYSLLKQGLKMRLLEDSQIEPYNDFQLHHLYILKHFLPYDTSLQARELLSQYKNYIKSTKDDQTKLVLINNRVASDRLLPASASLTQLSQIAQTRTSTHEITVKLNKVIAMLKQKQIKEARKELESIAKVDDLANVKDERVLGVYAYLLHL